MGVGGGVEETEGAKREKSFLSYLLPVRAAQSLVGAGIFKKSMGARNRGGIGLSYRPARLHRQAEFIPWNRFLGSINV